MSKRKIGEIYNKPIVTGDKNLVTKNEIHESTLKGGGSVEYNRWYYMLNSDKLKTDFNFTNQNNIPEDVTNICMVIDIMGLSLTLIAKEYDNQNYEHIKSASVLLHTLDGWSLMRNPCFVISDEVPSLVDIVDGTAIVIKGSLEERFKSYNEATPEMSEYLHYLDYIIPLSKEEFESKIPKEIDYKDFINQ